MAEFGLLVCSAQVWGEPPTHGSRGDRIEQRLDHRGDRVENRLDRRGDRADRAWIALRTAPRGGHEVAAERLDARGDRIDRASTGAVKRSIGSSIAAAEHRSAHGSPRADRRG